MKMQGDREVAFYLAIPFKHFYIERVVKLIKTYAVMDRVQ